MRRFAVGLLIVVSALALLTSSTSLWMRRNVINTDVFVSTAEQVLATPAVRSRITAQVVDTVIASAPVQQAIDQGVALLPPRMQPFRPSIEDAARGLLGRGVDALLTSPAFSDVTRAALTSAQTQLVTGQSVRFDLGQAKELVPAQNRSGLAGQVIDLIPDDIGVTVLTEQQAPQLYTAVDLLQSLWFWGGLIAIGTLAGAAAVSRRLRASLRAWAATTGVLGLLFVLALTVARGPLLARVKPINVEAADAVYGIIASSLITWTLWLVAVMAGIVLITVLWGRIGILPGIARGYRAVRAQAELHRQSRAALQDTGERSAEPWPRRAADRTRTFIESMGLGDRVATAAAATRRHLRVARWAGIALAALILLLWPSPTLSVLVWVAALVAVYLGLLELLMAVGDAHAVAVTEPPAPGRPDSRLDLLVRLCDARDAGLLTGEEFAREKARVLGT